MGWRASKGPIEGRARERDHVHLLGARLPQRASALVDRGSGRIDVVDQRERAWPHVRGEDAANVAPAGGSVEAALGSDAARAANERYDRQSPPARELRGQLGRWVGATQQQAIAHRRHDRECLDGRARQLVGDQGGSQPSR